MSIFREFKDIPEFKKEILEGELREIESLIGQRITIWKCVINKSFTFESEFATIQASILGTEEKFIFNCGGGLIMKYLRIAKEKKYFPFNTTISKLLSERSGNEYYVLE